MDQLDVPVCNVFKAKIYKDQLCYEADFNKGGRKSGVFCTLGDNYSGL